MLLGDIQSGSTGSEVRKWQQFLALDPDGKFGPQTLAATKLFQREQGLAVTGIVDDATLARATALGYGGPVSTVSFSDEGKTQTQQSAGPAGTFSIQNIKTRWNALPSWQKLTLATLLSISAVQAARSFKK